MTERHFYLTQSAVGPNYLVCVRSYGTKREWYVYQEGNQRLWYGSGVTIGSLSDAKRHAREALSKTLDTAIANPISTPERNLLIAIGIGAIALFAVSTLFAKKASAASQKWTASDLNTMLATPGTYAIDILTPVAAGQTPMTSAELTSDTQDTKPGITVTFESFVNADGTVASSGGALVPTGWPGASDATPGVFRMIVTTTAALPDLGEFAGMPVRGVWKAS